MTTPEPVSPAPDTWDLRHRLAARLARLDAEQWGGDHDFAPYGKDRESDSVVDAAAEVFEAVQAEREAGLRANLDQARAEVERLTEVYDRTHEALRGLLPKPGVTDSSLDDVPIGQLVILLARQLARAGARTIPDDAATRKLNQAVPLVADLVDGEDCSLDHHGYCQTHYWFSETECPQARAKRWLAELDKGAAPTTDPAPAAADGPCGCATCNPASPLMYLCARCGNKRCPGAANHANECTGSNATGQPGSLYEFGNAPSPTGCAGCNSADEFWCSCPEGYTPPADPAAREDTAPPDDEVVTLDDLSGPECGKTGRTSDVGCDGTCAACTPDDYGDDLGGWARRTPIQPEEA